MNFRSGEARLTRHITQTTKQTLELSTRTGDDDCANSAAQSQHSATSANLMAMIELNGQTYPSEVRQSQPVPTETQEVPAGSSEFPGLTESLGLHREVIEGQIISTADPIPDLDTLRATGLTGAGLRFAPSLAPFAGAGYEGEAVDGGLADPAGSGAPLPPQSETAPILLADNLPWQSGEAAAANALLLEMQLLGAGASVQRFVRYPDDRRVMLVFRMDEDSRSIQQQY